MQAVLGAGSRTRLSVTCKAEGELRQSRIGAKPIALPKGVTVTVTDRLVAVKGPKGELSTLMPPLVEVRQEEGKLVVARAKATRQANAFHGLARTLAANMVAGVTDGFEKRMEMVGTGYRASTAGKELTLNVGYSKPRVLAIPEGIKVTVEKNTALIISGSDKRIVGDFCATVRMQRPPEPYKGKGIRYAGEVIKLKEGKSGGKRK